MSRPVSALTCAAISYDLAGWSITERRFLISATLEVDSGQVQDHCNGLSQLSECCCTDVAASSEDPLW